MNIYITSETTKKLNTLFSNIKNYYVLDVSEFIKKLNVDASDKSSIYLINTSIYNTVADISKLKKYNGIIYSIKNIDAQRIDFLKNKFKNIETITRFVLIDNSLAPKYSELYNAFDEVLFYERFKRVKIIQCSGIMKDEQALIMDND